MATKEAQEIRTGMVLGDGFVVDSVYMALGSIPRSYFAKGRSCGVVKSSRYLGPFGYKTTVRKVLTEAEYMSRF